MRFTVWAQCAYCGMQGPPEFFEDWETASLISREFGDLLVDSRYLCPTETSVACLDRADEAWDSRAS